MVLICLTSTWWLSPLKQRGLNNYVKEMVANGALSLFSSVTFQYGGRATGIFDCNFDTRDLNFASHVPKFYRDILTVWQELHSKNPSTVKDYQNETVWKNRFIRIDGKSVFYASWWYKKGLLKFTTFLTKTTTFY